MVNIPGITPKNPERRRLPEKIKSREQRRIAVEKREEVARDIEWGENPKEVAMAINSGIFPKFNIDTIKANDGKIDDIKLENAVLAMAAADYDISGLSAEVLKLIENKIYDLQPDAGPGREFAEYAEGLQKLHDKIEKWRQGELEKVNKILDVKTEAEKESQKFEENEIPGVGNVALIEQALEHAEELGYPELQNYSVEQIKSIKQSVDTLGKTLAQMKAKSKGIFGKLRMLFNRGLKSDIELNENQLRVNQEKINSIKRLVADYNLEMNKNNNEPLPNSKVSDRVRERHDEAAKKIQNSTSGRFAA
ncbi:hypothetical protein D6827_02470 [Candidatus Parcubacteria bacterium]|nr:MAG: hypothetical protein D6827_02470 [Candidatus Parcubacteria bacterium]